jgi:hypothetical protein
MSMFRSAFQQKNGGHSDVQQAFCESGVHGIFRVARMA